MKITSGILKRVAVPAVVAGMALPMALATSAAAQSGPASTVTRVGSSVAYSAYNGENNKLTMGVDGTTLVVVDNEGIHAGTGCVQADANTALCGSVANNAVTRIAVELRDGMDTAFIGVDINTTVTAGGGADMVETAGGNDTIDVRDGVRGNDTVVSCGGGVDTAVGNPTAHISSTCERRAFY